jgi:hypothetical protein
MTRQAKTAIMDSQELTLQFSILVAIAGANQKGHVQYRLAKVFLYQ